MSLWITKEEARGSGSSLLQKILRLEQLNDFFWAEEKKGGGYWWPELSWRLDEHGASHPNWSDWKAPLRRRNEQSPLGCRVMVRLV